MSEDNDNSAGTIASLRTPYQFQPGNSLWKKGIENRKKLGKYPDADSVLQAAYEYFAWLEETPLQESKLVTYEGVSHLEEVPKMRAPSMPGLCCFLGIHRDTWGSWRRGDDRPELKAVVEWAEQVMYDWKYTGAAGGLLNPMIVSRDLGLVEKSELAGPGGGPLQMITSDLTPQQAAEAYAATLQDVKR